MYASTLDYVNLKFNQRWGPKNRLNIPHIPLFVSKSIMQELQNEFSEEFDRTSSHRTRHHNDMQDWSRLDIKSRLRRSRGWSRPWIVQGWRYGIDVDSFNLTQASGNPKKYQFAYSHFVNESTIELPNGTTAVRYKSTIIDYRKTEHPSYMAMWNDIDRNQWKIDKFFKFRKNLHFICVNDKIDHSAEGRL